MSTPPPAATGTARRAVRDELMADLPAVSASIVDAVRREIPAYASLAPAQLAEVSAIAAWGTSRVLEAWVDDTGLDEADLQRFRGIGAARALDGRPLPVVLRAYRVAGSCVTDLVAERAVDRLHVSDALALARLWMASIDALSEALYAGHSAAADRLSGDRDRALADLLDDLVTGRQSTRAALADRSRQLGVPLPQDPLLVVAASGEETVTPASWSDCLERLGAAAGLSGVRGGVGRAVLPRSGKSALRTVVAESGWRVAALGGHPLGDAARGFRLAEHALERAPVRALSTRGVLDDADAAVLATAAGHRDADPDTLARLVLGRLLDQPVMLEGLDAFLEAGSATDAALRLGCHPQTMRYRLRRVRELTGRDPRRPWDRFVLEVARVARPGAPPAGLAAPPSAGPPTVAP